MTKRHRVAVASVTVLALIGLVGTAAAHQLHHHPWKRMSTDARIAFLTQQVKHDRDVLRFYRTLPRRVACTDTLGKTRANCGLTEMQKAEVRVGTAWHRASLRIARKNLHKLLVRKATTGPVPWYWRMLHECEQPGSWTNGTSGSTFSGGLGIHRDVWGEIAGRLGLPSWAGAASPWQQIAVARVIMRQYGAGAWAGCAPKAQAVMNEEHI